MKIIKLIVLILQGLILFLPVVAQKSQKIPPEKPKLIVGIVVDQMRYDYLARYWDKYEKNGFKRLISEGSLCKNTHLDYLFTQTGVGHATIFTGAEPGIHGIVSNSWYQRLKGKSTYCVADDKEKTIGSKTTAGQASPRKMFTTTIGDELKLSNNKKSKVIGISIKDRAAILSAGHAANGAYWFDTETGNWITSSYYMDTLPKWVNEFNSKKFPDLYLDRQWMPLLPMEQYTESLRDSNIYEVGMGFSKKTFPYNLNEMRKNLRGYGLLEETPFGNTFTGDFALAAIVGENLGKDEFPDLLTVSFSCTDFIGHLYGITSIEVEDTYLRLDKEIAHILDFIDENFGKENVLVFLTADHGVAHIPKYLEDMKIPSGSFNYNSMLTLAKSYLNAIYGEGDWIAEYNEQQLYLNRNLIEDSKLSLPEFQRKVADFVVQFSGVANTITSTDLMTTNYTSGIYQKMQNNFNQNRSGDVFINLDPGWIEGKTDATLHNSGYNYDTHVPLIWYGWKIGRKSITRRLSVTEIVPTISSLLNIEYPNGCMSQPILELTE